jgi:hypothetical protein
MSSAHVVVRWGAEPSRTVVGTAPDLDQLLDQVDELARNAGLPQAIFLERAAEDGELSIVVGASRSLCSHTSADGEPPYLISVGEDASDDPFEFYVDWDHYTECARRNTIQPEQARMAARHFLLTGQLDPSISWEET